MYKDERFCDRYSIFTPVNWKWFIFLFLHIHHWNAVLVEVIDGHLNYLICFRKSLMMIHSTGHKLIIIFCCALHQFQMKILYFLCHFDKLIKRRNNNILFSYLKKEHYFNLKNEFRFTLKNLAWSMCFQIFQYHNKLLYYNYRPDTVCYIIKFSTYFLLKGKSKNIFPFWLKFPIILCNIQPCLPIRRPPVSLSGSVSIH